MHSKPVALVTGANKGIGLQVAKELALKGFKVLVGTRHLALGEAAAKSVGAEAVELDVTDQTSIEAAALRIEDKLGRLDVLVNNAGISRPIKPGTPIEEMRVGDKVTRASVDDMRFVFETNVFGVVAVTQAMLPESFLILFSEVAWRSWRKLPPTRESTLPTDCSILGPPLIRCGLQCRRL
ncbi:SDR family NAD(P)-dependent oxidoreductase [Ralstonia solanacearum]|uniref:SDR family NAD(P)-dependent oxidoreductase n=1 Tax=Ralstonia solanacearum TaxID=305 RepID=A0AAW5ZM65_RALSL|nr:SDR family NAD(P)-dependent oxidoreductase [Ralstonia solanacearum]MDB0570658.1 SDR family NAD(P)-dependent oxidoreductase [Ralstonia solanacearum]